jgi:hypothetical protein
MMSSMSMRAAAAAALSFAMAACSSAPSQPAAAAYTPTAAEVEAEKAGMLSALAPANLAKQRPAPPFDVTSNWFIDVSQDPKAWHFYLPPYPKLTPAAQKEFDTSMKYDAEGKVYKDDIGQCWPAGLPLIMTRYWPMAMVQKPTAIYMISGFMNSVRIIYLDGRKHTAIDEIVRTYNGESIGEWKGNELVVDTIGFRGDHHWMDQDGPAIPAGEKLHIVERFRMVNDNKQLEIEFTMTDPDHWEGEWKSTKRFNRVVDTDIQEVSCLPDLNEHIRSTTSKTQVFQ